MGDVSAPSYLTGTRLESSLKLFSSWCIQAGNIHFKINNIENIRLT